MPLLWLSSVFLSGIILGWLLDWPGRGWLLLAALPLFIDGLRRLLQRYLPRFSDVSERLITHIPKLPQFLMPTVPYAVLLAVLFLGAARFQSTRPPQDMHRLDLYNDREETFILEGELITQPDERDGYINLTVQVDQLHPTGELVFKPVQGLLLARVAPSGDYRYGDRVRLQGRLRTPFENEDFSYKDYLAHKGIYSAISCYRYNYECAWLLLRGGGNPILAWIYDLRKRASQVIYLLFPDPEASLLRGILLGLEAGISEDVNRAFITTGTSHIIAISGFNFAIVAGLFTALFGRLFGRWRGMLVAFLGIALYAVLAGASAVVVRAAIMGALAVFAVRMGRTSHGWNTLLFVAALMAACDPHVLWDVGFQLSFMATLGLVTYAEPLTNAFIRQAARWMPIESAQRIRGPVGEFFLYTLAAQVTTLPLILFYFQRFSLISQLANLLILPVQPPVMVLGGIATILGLVYLPLGQLFAYLAWPFVLYTIRVVEQLAGVGHASLAVGRIGFFAVVLFYILLFGWTFWGAQVATWVQDRFSGERSTTSQAVLIGVLGVLAVIVWRLALATPDGRLHLVVLDVGSGDGILIQTPGGRFLLVDGGPSSNALNDELGRRLPLGQRSIDYLVLGAAGEKQLAALPSSLERFPPGEVLWSGPPLGSYSARQLRQNLADNQIPILSAQSGHSFDLGEGANLEILTTGACGAVLFLEWGHFRALLPIGLDFESMQTLMDDHNLPTMTALLLSECGVASLNTSEWIQRWQPQVVLLSVAADDSQGCPDTETLQAVQGYTLLRTDLNGWIDLSSDGESLWVEVEQR